MRGCGCATCEAQRAYCKRPQVRERHAAGERARRDAMTEAQHARINTNLRARRRRHADEALQGGYL